LRINLPTSITDQEKISVLTEAKLQFNSKFSPVKIKKTTERYVDEL